MNPNQIVSVKDEDVTNPNTGTRSNSVRRRVVYADGRVEVYEYDRRSPPPADQQNAPWGRQVGQEVDSSQATRWRQEQQDAQRATNQQNNPANKSEIQYDAEGNPYIISVTTGADGKPTAVATRVQGLPRTPPPDPRAPTVVAGGPTGHMSYGGKTPDGQDIWNPLPAAPEKPSTPSYTPITLPSGAVVAYDNRTNTYVRPVDANGQPIGPDPTAEEHRQLTNQQIQWNMQLQAAQEGRTAQTSRANQLMDVAKFENDLNKEALDREKYAAIDLPTAQATARRQARQDQRTEAKDLYQSGVDQYKLVKGAEQDSMENLLKWLPFTTGSGFKQMFGNFLGGKGNFDMGTFSMAPQAIAQAKELARQEAMQVPTYPQAMAQTPYQGRSPEEDQSTTALLRSMYPRFDVLRGMFGGQAG